MPLIPIAFCLHAKVTSLLPFRLFKQFLFKWMAVLSFTKWIQISDIRIRFKMFWLHSNYNINNFHFWRMHVTYYIYNLVDAFNFLFSSLLLFLHVYDRFLIFFGVIHNTTKAANQMVYVGLALILVLMSRKNFYRKISWSLWCVHMSANMMVTKLFTQERYDSKH